MSTVDIDSYSCNDLVTENIRKVEGKLVDNTEARSGQFNKKAISGEDRFTLTKPIISERLYINRHGTLSTRHVPVQLMPQGILAQPTQITSTLPVASTGIEVSRILLPVPEPNSPDVLDEEITYSQPDEEPNKVEVSSTAPAGLVFGGLSAQLRSRLADTPIREQPDELARLAKLNPTDQTKVVGLLTQSYEAASPKPLTVQKALNQHRHEQAEASRLAVLASLSPKFTHSTLPDETKSSSPKIASGATGNGLVGVDEGESESWTVTAAQEVVECELVLADPPYGILKGVEWEPQEVSQLEEFSREWATRWGEQSGAGVIAIFWSEDYLFEGRRWFDESLPDYEFQQLLIWHYPNTLKPVGRGHFRNSYDPIFIYRRKGSLAPPAATTNWPAGVTQSDCHVGAIPQSNYLEVDRKFHPTQKPLSVALWLLSILSKPGDRIADPFCGSGTFGVAAVQLGRQYHGIELNEEYQKLTRHRILTYGVAEALQKNSQTSSQPRFEAI